jgi:hypothetical protein
VDIRFWAPPLTNFGKGTSLWTWPLSRLRIKTFEKTDLRDKLQYLVSYSWSSLAGYLSKRKKRYFIIYDLVLGDYGGDTDKAGKEYERSLVEEMRQGAEIKELIVGQIFGVDCSSVSQERKRLRLHLS